MPFYDDDDDYDDVKNQRNTFWTMHFWNLGLNLCNINVYFLKWSWFMCVRVYVCKGGVLILLKGGGGFNIFSLKISGI